MIYSSTEWLFVPLVFLMIGTNSLCVDRKWLLVDTDFPCFILLDILAKK